MATTTFLSEYSRERLIKLGFRETDEAFDYIEHLESLLTRCRAGFDWQQYDSPEQNQIGRDLDECLAKIGTT